MNLYKTNWYEKDPEEILDVIYNELIDERSRFDFFKHLMQNYPKLEIDWLATFEDMKEYLLMKERIDEILSFIDWYRAIEPQDYQHRYGYIERDLCSYYLFRKDYVSLKKRIDFVKKYPEKSIDVLPIRMLYQLIYHGLYKEAMDFATAVWKPLDEFEGLFGFPSYDFVNTIYTDNLQKYFEATLNNIAFDTVSFFEKASEMGFTNNRAFRNELITDISNDLNKELISESIRHNNDRHLTHLNIQFLKYMHSKYNMPFIFSELLWKFIDTENIFGKQGKDNWFYINAKTMYKHILKKLDAFILTHDLQIFGQVWGLDYVISFFEDYELISQEYAQTMRENNQYFKHNMVQLANQNLWQMNYVFHWPEINNTEKPPLDLSQFDATFAMDNLEATVFISRIMSSVSTNQRIERELQISKKSRIVSDIESDKPYIKTEAKVGRNDPCPCGSGKKYKKCCLKNN